MIVDEQILEHPKMRRALDLAGPHAFCLWHAALGWSVRNLTDGEVPAETAVQLANRYAYDLDADRFLRVGADPQRLIDALTQAGLWEKPATQADRPKPQAAGYQIHDFPEYQPTRARFWQLWRRSERKREYDLLRQRVRRKQRDLPLSYDIDSKGSSVSDLSAAVSVPRELTEKHRRKPRDTEPFRQLAERVTGTDERTLPTWLNAAAGLAGEHAAAEAEAALKARRHGRPPLVNEAKYVTKVLQSLPRERTR